MNRAHNSNFKEPGIVAAISALVGGDNAAMVPMALYDWLAEAVFNGEIAPPGPDRPEAFYDWLAEAVFNGEIAPPGYGRPYLMTSQEAADCLRVPLRHLKRLAAEGSIPFCVSLRQLKRWVAEGRIPVCRLHDRLIRFRPVDLEAFADKNRLQLLKRLYNVAKKEEKITRNRHEVGRR